MFAVTSCSSKDANNAAAEIHNKDSLKYHYLKNNMVNIDITDESFAALKYFNNEAKDYDIFFLGEVHSISQNYELTFYFLKNLHKNHEIRHVLSELGYATAQFINDYLQSGESAILDSLFDDFIGTAAYSRDFYNLIVNIRMYNETLPHDERIRFVGVDIQHQMLTGLKYLFSLLPDKSPPDDIFNRIYVCISEWGHEESNLQAKELAELTLKIIDGNIDIYTEYFGDKLFDFTFTCRNMIQSYDCYYANEIDFGRLREGYIYANFVELSNQYQANKFFGSWGCAHSHLVYSDMTGGNTLASYLNGNEPTKGRVLSILLLYNYGNAIRVNLDTIDLAMSLTESEFALFKLDGIDSPFIKNNGHVGERMDYGHQYFLTIKNRTPTTQY